MKDIKTVLERAYKMIYSKVMICQSCTGTGRSFRGADNQGEGKSCSACRDERKLLADIKSAMDDMDARPTLFD
jgi:hypothetical protein